MALWKLYVIVLVPIIGIGLIFKHLVSTNKIRPNKISKLFYNDDKSFVDYWKKEEEKGFIRYTLKNILITTIIMSVLGIFFSLNKRSMFGYEQNQTLVVTLSMGIILGLIDSVIRWVTNQVRERQILEKAMAESDKVDSTQNTN